MSCPPDAPFSIAGGVTTNIGLVVRAAFEQPTLALGKWITLETEFWSFNQWVAALDAASKAQGHSANIVYEEIDDKAFEEKFPIYGTETKLMLRYYADEKVGKRAFENTSGLPEVSLAELGVEGLVGTRELLDEVDCGKLLKEGETDEARFGAIGMVREEKRV
jgi:hypothetical protein